MVHHSESSGAETGHRETGRNACNAVRAQRSNDKRKKKRNGGEVRDVTGNLEAKIVQQFETFVEISQERVSEIFFARCT